MTFRLLTYRLMLLVAVALFTGGCADDHGLWQEETPDKDASEAGVWMSLQIGFPPQTRAADPSPTPGQWGDGTEPGVWNEYYIEDLNIYFFTEDADKAGLDSSGSVGLHAHKYIGKSDLTGPDGAPGTDDDPIKYVDHVYTYNYEIIGDDKPKTGDFAVVIANYGEDMGNIYTLGQLKDKTAKNSWRNGDKVNENTWFLMSNAFNNQYNKRINRVSVPSGIDEDKAGTKLTPYTAQIYLQRAAARIDLLYDDTNIPDAADTYLNRTNSLKYIVRDGDAVVELTHIYPVNVKQENTYIFKHLTADTDLPILYSTPTQLCADEKTASSGGSLIPDNYVVDCVTALKKAGVSKDNLMGAAWYGATARDKYLDDYAASENADKDMFTAAKGIASILGGHTPISAEADGYDFASVITYSEENTQGTDVNTVDFATGLLLRAVYHPKKVYTGIDSDGNPTGAGADYSYSGTLWRYMPNLDTSTGSGIPSSSGLTESKAIYFSSYDAAVAYHNARKSQNHGDAPSITEFKGGVCYYNLWIRHADIQDGIYDRPIPMEFGIVRNNLYRIALSFSGPGTPQLLIREPFNILPHIFVRPWNVRTHPEIIV